MTRTTVQIKIEERTKALWIEAAYAARMSLSEFVRTTVDWAIEEHPNLRGAPTPEQLQALDEQAPSAFVDEDPAAGTTETVPAQPSPLAIAAQQVREDHEERDHFRPDPKR